MQKWADKGLAKDAASEQFAASGCQAGKAFERHAAKKKKVATTGSAMMNELEKPS